MCLVGSFPMFVAGIRECRDIDLLLGSDNRARVTANEKTRALSPNVQVWHHRAALHRLFQRTSLTAEEIISNPHYHTRFEGYKVLRPEILFAIKLARLLDKDITDVKLIEAYALSCRDWDWDLVREHLPAAQPEKQRSGMLTRLRQVVTLARRAAANPRAAITVMRALAAQRAASIGLGKLTGPRPTHSLQSQIVTKIPTAALLGNQFIHGEFSRYDVLLRYLTIQSLRTGGEDLKPYYLRMQNERVGRETYQSLCELVTSIQNRGFLSRYPIPITEEGLILDGAHRLACALFFDVNEVPVTLEPTRNKIYYGRRWFAEHGFDDEMLGRLDGTKDSLFEKHGVWFPVILWPPVKPWFDEITENINSRHSVKWEQTINLGHTLPDFARRVYAIDDIERWKVELRLHVMHHYEPVVRVLAVDLPAPAFRRKKRTRTYLSGTGAALKKWVRESYADKVTDYFYDIVCHTGDNHEHNRKILEAIREFAGLDEGSIQH